MTSRFHFTLPGLVARDLDELPEDDARALLLHIEPRIGSAADEIARLCGRLPLALRLAGSALAERSNLSTADYARRLKEGKELDPVEASLNLSYELLKKDPSRIPEPSAAAPVVGPLLATPGFALARNGSSAPELRRRPAVPVACGGSRGRVGTSLLDRFPLNFTEFHMAVGLERGAGRSVPMFLRLAPLKTRSMDGPLQIFPMKLADFHRKTPARGSCVLPFPLNMAYFHRKKEALPMKSIRFHRKMALPSRRGLQIKRSGSQNNWCG